MKKVLVGIFAVLMMLPASVFAAGRKKASKGHPTPPTTSTMVREAEGDTPVTEAFTSFGALAKLSAKESELERLIATHRSELSGCPLFFLFRRGGEFFVADVRISKEVPNGNRGYRILRFPLKDYHVWQGECPRRVVIPTK